MTERSGDPTYLDVPVHLPETIRLDLQMLVRFGFPKHFPIVDSLLPGNWFYTHVVPRPA